MDEQLSEILRSFKGKRELLNYWIAGLVDGEGSFSVAIMRHPTQRMKFGWIINPCFQVYQHEKHREVLELCRFVFGTGSIYRKSGIHPVLNFSVDSRKNLIERVIPFFERYPLVTKKDTFNIFRDIVFSMERKEHWTKEGFKKIVELAFQMNQQGKGRRHTKNEVLAALSESSSAEILRDFTSNSTVHGDDKVHPPSDRKE